MTLDFSGGPYRLGVIGDPVAHSLSPALHQPALDELGISAVYERWHTTPDDLAGRIAELRLPETLGANVTIPHKVAVLGMVDDVSATAHRAGAVNTIVNRDGRLYGDNTDIYGFQTSLESVAESPPGVALLLGAGGATRAVVLALEAMGVTEIIVANRDESRAGRLAEDLRPVTMRTIRLDAEHLVDLMSRTDLLVNATSLGWHAGETPIDLHLLDRLPSNAIVADLTYRDTDLLKAAGGRGLKTLDGLPMLVHQGARAFEYFTGYSAPVSTMMAAALRARG